MSGPLKTYIRHAAEEGGFRASAGSWYFRTMAGAPEAVLTVLASTASLPVGAKLGFCFSTGGSSPLDMATSVEKAEAWSGRAPARRLKGLGAGAGGKDLGRDRDRRRSLRCESL